MPGMWPLQVCRGFLGLNNYWLSFAHELIGEALDIIIMSGLGTGVGIIYTYAECDT